MINKRVRKRKDRAKDEQKLDFHDRFMLQYMSQEWFEEQKRKAETIFIGWLGEENLRDKS